jgi:hypothetical protein
MNDAEYAHRLHIKLTKAGVQFNGVGQNGIVYDVDGKTQIQKRPDVAAVIAQGVNDPLEGARGKLFTSLPAPLKDAVVAELLERMGITVDGIVQ